MASGFWTLKDGRGFSRRVITMVRMMQEIHAEMQLNPKSRAFTAYMQQFVMTDEHELNGFGGFYHKTERGDVMMDIDFREFTTENQVFFWEATQKRINRLVKESRSNKEDILHHLKVLMEMNKRIRQGEDPMKLNHYSRIQPPSGLQKGPGWVTEEK